MVYSARCKRKLHFIDTFNDATRALQVVKKRYVDRLTNKLNICFINLQKLGVKYVPDLESYKAQR